jgi:glycosyltransferase involved in cell wall biosynthesis
MSPSCWPNGGKTSIAHSTGRPSVASGDFIDSNECNLYPRCMPRQARPARSASKSRIARRGMDVQLSWQSSARNVGSSIYAWIWWRQSRLRLSCWSNATMNDISCISVVVPNFNHGKFLESALHALISQSPTPAEIVVVDDASTDDSVSVIREFAAGNPSVRLLVNSENVGAIRSMKRGLDVVTGRYIYLAAADDWVMPGFFALATQMLESNSRAGLFCGDTVVIDGESGRYLGHRPIVRPFYRARAADAEEARRILRRIDNWILTGGTIFRRDALDFAGGLDESLGSFADGYVARKIAVTRGFCYAPRPVAGWRIFSNSVSRLTALDLESARQLLQRMPEIISSDPSFPAWYAPLFRNRWRFAVSRLAAETSPINYAVLDSMVSDFAMTARILKLIRLALAHVPSLERVVTLTLLAIRLRPYPLWGLVATKLSRLRDTTLNRPVSAK